MTRTMGWIVTGALVGAAIYAHAQDKAATSPTPQSASTQSQSATGDLSGKWQGTAAVGNGQRVLIAVTRLGAAYKATLYLIDGGGRAVAIPAMAARGADVSFKIPGLSADYSGTLNPDGKSMAGSVTMADGSTHVLNLTRVNDDAAWAIPEPPKPMVANAVPKFDVVTVKPSDPNTPGKLFTIRGRHIVTVNTSVSDLMTFAYSLHPKELLNGPPWLGEKYDLDGVPDVEGQPSLTQMRMLIQDALKQRFALKFHHDQRELAVYALTIAKGGPKLTVTADPPSAPVNFNFARLGQLHVTNATMKNFCEGMQGAVMDKPVVNQTGLTDRYDFNLNWTPDESQFTQMGGYRAPEQEDPNAAPSLYTALQEQLGLKLDPTKAVVDVMVVDHAERPSAN